jgi:hypothetical protein
MRTALQARDGQQCRYRATVGRFGSRRVAGAYPVRTVLLLDVVDVETGEVVADHLWMTAGRWSAALRIGDQVEFDATAAPYQRGYFGPLAHVALARPPSRDWRLERPARVAAAGGAR